MARLAVLWDLDGTISDSFDAFYIALEKLGEHHAFPVQLTYDEYKKDYFGMTFGEILLSLFQGEISQPQIDIYTQEYFQLTNDAIQEGHIRPVPLVEDLLKELKSRKVPMAIGSSSKLETIIAELQALNFLHYFDNILSGNLMPSKPASDIFLAAAQAIHVKPEQCVVIEDSVAGIHSANNAGIKCVGITTTKPANEIQDADLIIDSFDQLSFQRLEDLLNS